VPVSLCRSRTAEHTTDLPCRVLLPWLLVPVRRAHFLPARFPSCFQRRPLTAFLLRAGVPLSLVANFGSAFFDSRSSCVTAARSRSQFFVNKQRAVVPYFRLPSHVARKLLALFNRRSSYDFSSARHLVSLVRCVSALAFMLSFTRRVGPGLCLFSSSSCSAISLLQFIDLLWFV
jgi:hypothetical protein